MTFEAEFVSSRQRSTLILVQLWLALSSSIWSELINQLKQDQLHRGANLQFKDDKISWYLRDLKNIYILILKWRGDSAGLGHLPAETWSRRQTEQRTRTFLTRSSHRAAVDKEEEEDGADGWEIRWLVPGSSPFSFNKLSNYVLEETGEVGGAALLGLPALTALCVQRHVSKETPSGCII